jgi:MSHA pilin protein MshD
LALVGVYRQATINNVDPIIRMRALESAQSLLDEILLLKYDEKTPTGGVPACRPLTDNECNNTKDGNLNDVDDYDGVSDTFDGFTRSVSVTTANNIKLITVRVTTPIGDTVLLSAERANF